MTPQSPCLFVSLSFFFCGIGAAFGIGALAATVSLAGWSPVGIFSLGVGVVVGTVVWALATMFRVACPLRLTVATIVMALVAVLAQHAWLYRDYRKQWQSVREREPALALFRSETQPMSPGEYFATEYSPARLAFWAVDTVLAVTGATAVLLLGGELLEKVSVAADANPSCPPTPDP